MIGIQMVMLDSPHKPLFKMNAVAVHPSVVGPVTDFEQEFVREMCNHATEFLKAHYGTHGMYVVEKDVDLPKEFTAME